MSAPTVETQKNPKNAYMRDWYHRKGKHLGKLGRPVHKVAEGLRWCSIHQKGCPESTFTGKEHSCKAGKYEYHIQRKYGLSIDDLVYLKDKQNDKCAICGGSWKYVDHNHKTGNPRGLLCPRCNTLVGYLETNPDHVDLALNYISRNE